MVIFTLTLGLVVLTGGAELLVRSASKIAAAVGISPLVVGLTVVAFGTSASELVVSIQSTLRGQPDVALGNVVGSNIFNVLFILGTSALIVPLRVSQQLIRFDVPLMIVLSMLVFVFALDKHIGRLIVTETGTPWYRDNWNNPATQFAKWWQAKPSKSVSSKGVVTKLSEKEKDFLRYTIKWLRKILPNLVRPKYGKEIADLLNARKVDRSGRVAGRDTDRYADRLYDEAANALLELEEHFRPFLDALKRASPRA